MVNRPIQLERFEMNPDRERVEVSKSQTRINITSGNPGNLKQGFTLHQVQDNQQHAYYQFSALKSLCPVTIELYCFNLEFQHSSAAETPVYIEPDRHIPLYGFLDV